ncbi:MAG TPA: M23 family metallopeptidase, partial [Chloroflexia bacterium]|nr:M23 family metallopeptidase [Chloroflexia bacterium]
SVHARVAEIRHSLDVYAQIEDDLTSVAAQRLQEWLQMSEDDATSPPVDVTGSDTSATDPAVTGAKTPAGKGKTAPAGVSSHLPQGLPYYGAISSPFGWRSSPFVKGKVGFHTGVDIVAPMGTAVHATQAGRVTLAGWSNVYGRVVMIDHGNGWSTLYGHNSHLLVAVGQWVGQGQVISYSGSTGMSTGPHIHYEVRHNNIPVNPMRFR